VIWQQTDAENGVVTAIEPRRTVLSRPGYGGRIRALAANLSQIVIVFAPEPPPAGDLIDQYLIAAETLNVNALLVCNKADQLATDAGRMLLDELAHYQHLGYALLCLSAREPAGLTPLIEPLCHHTSILVGQSGVGKSSLIQALLPDQPIQIGRLSRATGLGRHTTSAATCYRLPGGGYLIDSPGVRSFRLPPLDRAGLERGFREFRPYLGRCRFNDCRHAHEPGCALQAAVVAGKIAAERMQVFQRLLSQLQSNNPGG
jgi:ribosome biogenesis GTPase